MWYNTLLHLQTHRFRVPTMQSANPSARIIYIYAARVWLSHDVLCASIRVGTAFGMEKRGTFKCTLPMIAQETHSVYGLVFGGWCVMLGLTND